MRRASEVVLERTPTRYARGVELVLRTIEDTIDDRVPGLAAEVAFFVLLSLPPLLLLALGGVGYLGEFVPEVATDAEERLLQLAGTVLTAETVELLRPIVEDLLSEGRADLASLGIVLTIYSASRALRVIVVALSIAYDLEESRPSWAQRIFGLAFTVLGVLLSLIAVPLLVSGPRLGVVVGARIGAPGVLDAVWTVAYWPVAAVVATGLIASLYHWAAPWSTPWRRDIPGALLAMVVWLAGSAGLRIYVRQSIVGDDIFAPLAGPLVLLLWLYVSAFAVLLGAELNAEIEKLWPTGSVRPHHRDPADLSSRD